MFYFVTPIKHNHGSCGIPETTTTTTPVQATVNLSLFQMSSSTSNASMILPPSGKQFLCFQSDGISFHAAQCSKSRALTKLIGLIIGIESFDQ